jgi:hypothetical protein
MLMISENITIFLAFLEAQHIRVRPANMAYSTGAFPEGEGLNYQNFATVLHALLHP